MNSREEIFYRFCDTEIHGKEAVTKEKFFEALEYAQQFRSPDMAEALTSEELGELIDKHIGGMFGGLEMASIDHFKQTGKINGSFRLRLISLMKFYEFKLKDKALSSPGSGWVKQETISDGLGSEWLKKCPDCGKDEMVVVRPGKVQCNNCG